MALQVVGAGLGRTGTHSLKLALEQLLGGTCYHMVELFPRPEQIPVWHRAILGESVDWDALFGGFVAAVDWPTAAVWREIHRAYPEAVVLLSVRDSPAAWWASFSQTILEVMSRAEASGSDPDPWTAMSRDMLGRLSPDGFEPDVAMAAYEAHNQEVREAVAPDRLVEWKPGDGWGPICAALGRPEPAAPFPHVNTSDDFRSRAGLRPGA